MEANRPRKILFVCMGNICRSPVAKGFFDRHVEERGLQAKYYSESAGTHGWHAGQPPDARSIQSAQEAGIDISNDLSRQVTNDDYSNFDYIVAMDTANLKHLEQAQPLECRARLVLMLSFSPASGLDNVPDPYYGATDGFGNVCQLLELATGQFLDEIERQSDDQPSDS